MVSYRIRLEPDDNDTLLATCPDLPGVVTYGDTREVAMAHAVDAIETWIASLIADGLDVPRPTTVKRRKAEEAMVTLPALTALKLELYWALRDSRITRAELMRRLNWNRESVDRLFRLDHASRLDQIEAAFRALGRQISVQ
ncbi:MAG: type II toxin-antitoxin system HicB family antitoxin, partial [Rhizobiales bacterium]|nr:type II toxin-antitoxin system HicB family antitoxin [Hyphomicrobiales bacterium]